MKLRVLVDGYFGAENIGDEAILHMILRDLNDAGVSRIAVTSFSPGSTERLHGVVAVERADFGPKWRPRHLGKLVQAVAGADIVLIGGGGSSKTCITP